MTLISWRTRLDTPIELVSRKVCTMVSTWVARTIRLRIEYFWSERTNSVRSSGTLGSLVPRPRIISTSGSNSRAWAMRPPQKVSSPVIRTRLPIGSAEPDAAALAQHVVQRVLQLGPDGLRLVHHPAPRVPLQPRIHVEGDGIEDAQLDLRRQVGDVAEGPEDEGVGGNREVRQFEGPGHATHAEEDGHRLLGTDHSDGDDGHAGLHGDLHEPAPTEAAEPVAVGVGLGRGLGPLGEHQRQLVLVVQEAVGVVGMCRYAAGPGPQGTDHRDGAEEVVGQSVDRAPELFFDAVHDGGGIRRDGAGMVCDQQGPAVGRDLLQSLPLNPEPVAVQRVVQAAHDGPHVLGATPFVDVGPPRVVGLLAPAAIGGHRQDGHRGTAGGTGLVVPMGDVTDRATGVLAAQLTVGDAVDRGSGRTVVTGLDDGIDDVVVGRAARLTHRLVDVRGVRAHTVHGTAEGGATVWWLPRLAEPVGLRPVLPGPEEPGAGRPGGPAVAGPRCPGPAGRPATARARPAAPSTPGPPPRDRPGAGARSPTGRGPRRGRARRPGSPL